MKYITIVHGGGEVHRLEQVYCEDDETYVQCMTCLKLMDEETQFLRDTRHIIGMRQELSFKQDQTLLEVYEVSDDQQEDLLIEEGWFIDNGPQVDQHLAEDIERFREGNDL